MEHSSLLEELVRFRGEAAFNQYAQVDPKLDVPLADSIRLDNLRLYLDAFSGASFALVGEAPSFHGCRFSGIPFTAEEQLLGASPLAWAKGRAYRRTSTRSRLMSEHSGSIVWELLGARRDIVLWNAFPWHSHAVDDVTRNRKPSLDELESATGALSIFLRLFPKAKVYAVGRTAEHALSMVGCPAEYIRHPARGGKTLFRDGVAHIG